MGEVERVREGVRKREGGRRRREGGWRRWKDALI